MKTLILIALLVSLTASSPAGTDAVLPWGGDVPGGVFERRVVVQVFDAVTGRPIEGVQIRVHDEDATAGFVGAKLLGKTVTGEFGIASLEWMESAHDAHWIFEAKGYAIHEEYGSVPPDRVWLLPGGEIESILLDPFGRPAPGVEVNLLLGCGHSPTVRMARTNADGLFRMTGVTPGRGRLWCRMAGATSDYLDVPEKGASIAPDPGRTISGVLVDPEGEPVRWALVTSTQTHRGPTTITNDRGWFRLVGVGLDADVRFFHDSFREGIHNFLYLGDCELPPLEVERPPLRLVLPPADWDEDDYGAFLEPDRFAVPIRIEDQTTGTEIPELSLYLVSEKTGLGVEDEETGRRVVNVAPGGYLVSPGHGFEGVEAYRIVSPKRVEIVAGRTEPIVVKAATQPALEIKGVTTGMDDLDFTLVTPARALPLNPRELGEPVYLEQEVRAVLRVEGERQLRFFPVEPIKDGKRSVTVNWVSPEEEPEEEVPEIPSVGGVRLLNADGQPVAGREVRIERRHRASQGTSDEDGWFGSRRQSGTFSGNGAGFLPERRTAAPFLLIVDSFVTRMIVAKKSGDLTVRYPRGKLDLTVTAADGTPLDFGICVDGMPGKGHDGKLLLRGVEPGRREDFIGAAGYAPVLCLIDVPEDEPKSLLLTLRR